MFPPWAPFFFVLAAGRVTAARNTFRSDIGLVAKLTWAIASIVPFVPFVYVLTGNDFI